MTLRKRFNLAFLLMFCTSLVGMIVVFLRTNTYVEKTISATGLGQGAVVVERLRNASLEEALRVKSDPDRISSQEHDFAMSALAAGLDRVMALYQAGGPFEEGERSIEQVKDTLAKAQATDFADEVVIATVSRNLHDLAVRFQTRSVENQGLSAETAFTVVALAGAACILVLLEFGIFWILIRSWTIYPIGSLAMDAQRLKASDSDFLLTVDRDDELGMLARSLNEMVDRLREGGRQLARARELAAVGEICSGVAHGMRNPLAVIRLSAQRVAQRQLIGESELVLLDEMVTQVDRLDARIARLLRFASSMEPRYEKVEFGWLSGVAVRESMAALGERTISVDVIDETGGVACPMDPDLAVQAVVECMSNSAIHSSPGATIRLKGVTHAQDNGHPSEWVVSIEDQGRGIEPHVMGNIFDLFFTLRETGTGVGLSMVKRILDQHHGRIQVRSTPGQGTTVELHWPLKNGRAGH